MGIRTKVWRPGVDPDADFTLTGEVAIDGAGNRFLLDDPILPVDVTTDFSPAMTTAESSIFPGVTCGKPGSTPHEITSLPTSGVGSYTLIATVVRIEGESDTPFFTLNLGGDGAAYNAAGVYSNSFNFIQGTVERHWNGTLFEVAANLTGAVGADVPLDMFISQNRQFFAGFDKALQAGGSAVIPAAFNAQLLGGLPPTGNPSIQIRNQEFVGDYEITHIRAYAPKIGIISLNNVFQLPDNFRSMKRLYIDGDSYAGGTFSPDLIAQITAVDYTKNTISFAAGAGLEGFALFLGGTLRIDSTEYVGRLIGNDNTGDPELVYLLEDLPGSGTDLVGHFVSMATTSMAPCIGKQDSIGYFYPLRVDLDLEETMADYANRIEKPPAGLMQEDTNFPISFAAGDDFVWKIALTNADLTSYTVPYSRRYGIREVALEFDTTESAACATALAGA